MTSVANFSGKCFRCNAITAVTNYGDHSLMVFDGRFHQTEIHACVFFLEHYSDYEHVNVEGYKKCTIMNLARRVVCAVGFEGRIVVDSSMPDSTPREFMDRGRLFSMGWQSRVGMEEGLRAAYGDLGARYGEGTAC